MCTRVFPALHHCFYLTAYCYCDPTPLTVVLSHPLTSSVTAGQASKRPCPLEKVNELSPSPAGVCVCSLLSAAVGVMYRIRPLARDSVVSLVCPRSDKQVRRRYLRWDARRSLSPPAGFGVLGNVDAGSFCQIETCSESLGLVSYLETIPWHLLG